ncbi:pyridoxal 5'-phosphate synthase glutaminase subunit PdxT [Atopobacter sp. AH10]|uniref:pyridoxal 5'-phosphate synthase glutaminase subunit PdxT n=1 Tax=Atopobacter sp. AH10 TaxID=2315861 RepID=UPI000EF240AE|nr:pyridoxal 5'-phosphate synthase glutaminase subunit PdxT [Atopobacter sp. AH10]RLK63082.1 pyridoxal 5'-phosphate synthase glutaminase subunit PdxT [Atopobacter sp. AH10]
MLIGVLAVQGAFIEHEKALEELGATVKEIRQVDDLEGIDGIVLPGGESTVQGKLLKQLGIFDPLQQLIQNGLPVLATCAGLILLAEELLNDTRTHLRTLPITVKRNAYGRQLASFQSQLTVGNFTDFPAIFIRGPYIEKVAPDVKVLATVDDHAVAVEYKNQIGLAFHPELSQDRRIHRYFLDKVANRLSH